MKPPFIYLTPAIASSDKGSLLQAALDGNLGRLKGIIKNLGMRRAAVLSVIIDGFSVLHCAAAHGHLEVCKYLVEGLGGDPNMVAGVAEFEGITPFMFSVHSGDVCVVKYFLDHGGDPTKADAKGRSVLHYAMCTGSCKITKFLLSEGIPVDIDCGNGTPLLHAASSNEDKTLKILLDHNANPNGPLMNAFLKRSLKCMELLIKAGADINCKGSLVSPLLFATGQGGYTDLIPLLLKAGADPNLPDDMGWLPIVRAAFHECREEIEMLLPLTSPIPDVPNWSVYGLISYAKFKKTQAVFDPIYRTLDFHACGEIEPGMNKIKNPLTEGSRMAIFKSKADDAFRRKNYAKACENYSLGVPDATLYSNRSVCKLKMGDGKGALSDAKQSRMLRPGWAKACYRQGAAHMLLKEYKQACEAFLDAEKLDPGNEEIKRELQKAMELMKSSPEQ